MVWILLNIHHLGQYLPQSETAVFGKVSPGISAIPESKAQKNDFQDAQSAETYQDSV